MDYKKIHDAIIERARPRVYDKNIHHKHHIIPIHECATSTDLVFVTRREHALLHRLRYKFIGTIGNFLAWRLLVGHDTSICSAAGKVGGRATRNNNSGIFSPSWDRGAQSRLNHLNGVAGFATFDPEKFLAMCIVAGTTTKNKQVGIFDPALQHKRSEWASIGGTSLTQETRGGICSIKWRQENPQAVFDNNSKGGKIGGKKVGSMLWWNNGTINRKSFECPGPEWQRGIIMSEKRLAQMAKIAGHNRKKEIS